MTPSIQEQLRGIRTVRDILDDHQRSTRANIANDGRGFQKELEETISAYHGRRVIMAKKIDPPVRVVGTGLQRKVIFMSNPFLDFLGTWTARGGRALVFEAKSTKTHLLRFNADAGFTMAQMSSLKAWRASGAVTFLLWQFNGRVAFFSPEQLLLAEGNAAKSLVHENGLLVPQGQGSMIWDFMPLVDAAF